MLARPPHVTRPGSTRPPHLRTRACRAIPHEATRKSVPATADGAMLAMTEHLAPQVMVRSALLATTAERQTIRAAAYVTPLLSLRHHGIISPVLSIYCSRHSHGVRTNRPNQSNQSNQTERAHRASMQRWACHRPSSPHLSAGPARSSSLSAGRVELSCPSRRLGSGPGCCRIPAEMGRAHRGTRPTSLLC